MSITPFIKRLCAHQDLSQDEMRAAFERLMSGQATDAQIGAFLVALRMKGETTDEIAGAAAVMRAHVDRVDHGLSRVLDTCGTGGDGANTFNISTAVAFVAAGAGCRVAKHGNRAISSRSGSADVLEALGVRLDVPHERLPEILESVGLVFLFAPSHHPAMRHVMPARRQLGVRTVMNLLGPLTNPAGATHQLVGVYDGSRIEAIATVLGQLGAQRAVVAHGHDGMDEISPCGPTDVAIWQEGRVARRTVRPEDLGLRPVSVADIAGGEAADNALIIRAVLGGHAGPARDTVLLNAAWAIFAGEQAESPDAGLALARESIDSGRAAAVLARLVEASAA